LHVIAENASDVYALASPRNASNCLWMHI